jgi:trehalose 6-phosphate synthase
MEPSDLQEILHGRSLVIASNRGPIAFEKDSGGGFVARRGAGGLVTALSHVMAYTPGRWVASAMTRADREMAGDGTGQIDVDLSDMSLRLRYLAFEHRRFDAYYNGISNGVLWFLQHALWNSARQPRFDQTTRDAWAAYHEVNQSFAEAIAEETAEAGAPAMLHDYHLMLVASYLRKFSPDAFIYHFTHSPWTGPEGMRVLPGKMAEEILEGMLSNDLLGFQTSRWAQNFMWCCQTLLGARVDMESGLVAYKSKETVVRHYPISIDVEAVKKIAHSPEGDEHLQWLTQIVGDRKLILRIDRLELSKNILRGFRAYEEFLKSSPEWQTKVVHVALLYPSRRALSEYRSYEADVLDMHDRINAELGTDDWQPIILVNEDNYTRALACLRRYDVLLVNPIIDGMNLVSKEGPAINEVDGVVVLSRNAGSWQELAHGVIGVNPYDIAEMSEALQEALVMDAESRAARASALRDVVEHNNPTKWVWHQLRDIRRLN